MSLTTGTYAVFTTSEGTIKTRLFPETRPRRLPTSSTSPKARKDWTHPTSGKKSTRSSTTGPSSIASFPTS